jgi:hypothetical protein
MGRFNVAIMKIYNGLSEQARFILNDVPTMLARAEKLQPAAEMIKSLEQFRDRWSSYPVSEDNV